MIDSLKSQRVDGASDGMLPTTSCSLPSSSGISSLDIRVGDCRQLMRKMPDESVQCCVTSPPYWGLRDYGHDGQIGQESTPEAFVQTMVDVFREVRRVLKADGTCWVNLGDSYNNSDKWGGGHTNTGKHTLADDGTVPSFAVRKRKTNPEGIKPKDLVGIPWMVAFALRADGWYLRQDIIWAKPNPMPESLPVSVLKDLTTLAVVSLLVYVSQGSKWWTLVTGLMFIFWVVAKIAAVTKSRYKTFKTKAELQEWVDSIDCENR